MTIVEIVGSSISLLGVLVGIWWHFYGKKEFAELQYQAQKQKQESDNAEAVKKLQQDASDDNKAVIEVDDQLDNELHKNNIGK